METTWGFPNADPLIFYSMQYSMMADATCIQTSIPPTLIIATDYGSWNEK